jgi:hypothetical protein
LLQFGGADPAFGGVTSPIAIGAFSQSQDTEFVLNYAPRKLINFVLVSSKKMEPTGLEPVTF